MKKELLIVGVIFAVAGGVTAKTVQILKERKNKSNEEEVISR